MPDAARLRETELALLNAPFDPGGWRHALELVAHATGSNGANLVAVGGPLAPSLNLFTGKEAAVAERHFGNPNLWGACNWRVNSQGRPLTVQYERDYAAYRQVADTSDYDDAVSDMAMQFGCQSVLVSDSRTFLGIATLRGPREGPCDAEALTAFRALLRPLQRSLRLEMTLAGEASEMMLGDLSGLGEAVVLLDRHGCLCAISPAAEHLAGPDGPLRLSERLLELCNRDENRRMQASLGRLLSAETPGDAGWVQEMRIGRAPDAPRRGWIARAFRLPRREHCLGFQPHIAIAFERAASFPLRLEQALDGGNYTANQTIAM